MAAPKPAPTDPVKVKHHTHVHPFFAFLVWLGGLVIWCGLSVGPGQYLEVYLMREADYARPELASVAFYEADDLLGEASEAMAANPVGCRKNPAGGLSCEPASAPVVRVERTPAITDMRLAALGMNLRPWKVQFLPALLTSAIGYVGGTLMFLVALLLGSRRG